MKTHLHKHIFLLNYVSALYLLAAHKPHQCYESSLSFCGPPCPLSFLQGTLVASLLGEGGRKPRHKKGTSALGKKQGLDSGAPKNQLFKIRKGIAVVLSWWQTGKRRQTSCPSYIIQTPTIFFALFGKR